MEFMILVVLIVFSFLPTIIAFMRGHTSKWGIFAMNLILGWTFLFWIWAFIWSLTDKGNNQTVIVNNQINN